MHQGRLAVCVRVGLPSPEPASVEKEVRGQKLCMGEANLLMPDCTTKVCVSLWKQPVAGRREEEQTSCAALAEEVAQRCD